MVWNILKNFVFLCTVQYEMRFCAVKTLSQLLTPMPLVQVLIMCFRVLQDFVLSFLLAIFFPCTKIPCSLNNMAFHSTSPCSKVSWFPVSDKLGETLITLISQKAHLRARSFYSESKQNTLFRFHFVKCHLYFFGALYTFFNGISISRVFYIIIVLIDYMGNNNVFTLYYSKK